MNNIEFSDVKITGGYWKARQDINCSVTLKAVYDRFNETGRFEALGTATQTYRIFFGIRMLQNGLKEHRIFCIRKKMIKRWK